MSFTEWRTQIQDGLMQYGVRESEALAITNSKRGMYHNETTYTEPEEIVKSECMKKLYLIMSSAGMSLFKKRYCKEMMACGIKVKNL